VSAQTHPPGVKALFKIILGNAGLLFLAQMGAKAISFIFFLLLARWLGVAQFGELTYAVAIALLVDRIADAGMARVMLREASRTPELTERLLGVIVPLKLGACVLLYGVTLIILLSLNGTSEIAILFAIIGASVAFSGPALLFEQVLHSRAKFGYVALAHLLLVTAQFAGAALAHAAGGGAEGVAAMLALGNAVYLGVIVVGLRRLDVRFTPRLDPAAWRQTALSAAPYAVVAAMITITPRVEFVVLGQFATEAALGSYGAALRVFEAALIAPIAFAVVLTPRFIHFQNRPVAELSELYAHSARAMLSLALPVSVVGVLLSDFAVSVLLPPEYAGAGAVLSILFLAYPALSLHLLNLAVMIGAQRQLWPALLMTALILAQAGLAFVLIARTQDIGAARALALSMAGACVVTSIAVRVWFLDRFNLLRAAAPPAIGGLAAFLAILWISGRDYAEILAPACALLAFAAASAPLFVLLPVGRTHATEQVRVVPPDADA